MKDIRGMDHMLKNYLFCPKQGHMVPKSFCRVCTDDCALRPPEDQTGCSTPGPDTEQDDGDIKSSGG